MLRSRNIPFFFAIYYRIQSGGGFRTSVRRSRAHFFSVRAGRPARMPGRRVSGRPIQAAGRFARCFAAGVSGRSKRRTGPALPARGHAPSALPAIAAGFKRQSDGRAAVCAPAAMRNPRHSGANPARVAARRSPARKSAAVLPKNASARPGGERSTCLARALPAPAPFPCAKIRRAAPAPCALPRRLREKPRRRRLPSTVKTEGRRDAPPFAVGFYFSV